MSHDMGSANDNLALSVESNACIATSQRDAVVSAQRDILAVDRNLHRFCNDRRLEDPEHNRGLGIGGVERDKDFLADVAHMKLYARACEKPNAGHLNQGQTARADTGEGASYRSL